MVRLRTKNSRDSLIGEDAFVTPKRKIPFQASPADQSSTMLLGSGSGAAFFLSSGFEAAKDAAYICIFLENISIEYIYIYIHMQSYIPSPGRDRSRGLAPLGWKMNQSAILYLLQLSCQTFEVGDGPIHEASAQTKNHQWALTQLLLSARLLQSPRVAEMAEPLRCLGSTLPWNLLEQVFIHHFWSRSKGLDR